MAKGNLTVTADFRGIRLVEIVTRPDERGEGVALLERIASALRELDQAVRGGGLSEEADG